jgi:hypothetical protein
MGGTKRNDSGLPGNCLVVHPSCHAMIETSRERALRNGWLVSQWKDPQTVPVKLWSGWALLRDDGSVLHKASNVDVVVDEFGNEGVGDSDGGGASGD